MSHKPAWQNSFLRLVILLLFLGSLINYLDRSLLSVVMPQVRQDLSLSNTDYGLAIHVFLLMYAIFYILGGRIADRLGYLHTFTLAVVVWSAAAMAHACVHGLRSLFLCRALLGIGEGIYYPAAIRGVTVLFPPATRAKAVGAILSAISVGLLAAPPLVAATTLHFGWRAAFIALGGLALLLLPPWYWAHRRGRDAVLKARADVVAASHPAAGMAVAGEATLGEVLRTRKYWCVLAARGCSDTAWYFYLFWMPGYFQDVRGLSLAAVGKLLWVPYFCSFLGAFAGAGASGALIRRGWGLHRSYKTALLVAAPVCTLCASSGFVPGTFLALALFSLALFAHQWWSTNIHTVITQISPAKHVAILYGMTGAAGTFIGAATQLVIGRVIDLYGYGPAFFWAGGFYVLAAGLILSAGTLEPIRSKIIGIVNGT